jgi:CubicO group peptidase (beta-lactamase class C family)
MKKYLLFLFVIVLSNTLSLKAQIKKIPADIEEKITLVENNLAGWVQTGNNDTWSLTDRMKKYNINGVSIAVIHNNKIEWAKGYGYLSKSIFLKSASFRASFLYIL